MKKVTFHFSLLTFNLVYRAYQSLKLLFDPAVEGNPYVKETERSYFVEPKRPVFLSSKLGIKGLLRGYKGI